MKLNIVFATLLLVAFIVPGVTKAYSVTNTTATDLGNGYALFTVTYKFGFLNRDLYIPVTANRNTKFNEKSTNATYSILFNGQSEAKATSTILNKDDVSASLNYSILPGKSKAIVLSDAEIKNDQYYTPQGKSDTFTLIALVDLTTTTKKDKVSLQMTSLPFTMVEGKKQTAARVTPEELETYKTSEISVK